MRAGAALIPPVTVREVAKLLATRSIPVAPLKGVLWQQTLYGEDPAARRMVDVDLLVPKHAFQDAQQELSRQGFRPCTSAGIPWERTWRHAKLPIPVDLHCMLFPPGRYNLETPALFARSVANEELFGVKLWILDPYDQLAHQIGHFVNAHNVPTVRDRQDFLRLVECEKLCPRRAAVHLANAGLGRAARVGLPQLATEPTQRFVADMLNALPSDPLGTALARCAHLLLQTAPSDSPRATFAAHLVARSLPAAMASLLLTSKWSLHKPPGIRRQRQMRRAHH